MSLRDELPGYAVLALVGLAILYFAWLRPRLRDRAIERLLTEAVAAYEQRDCETANERFDQARGKLRADTMSPGHQEIRSLCLRFTSLAPERTLAPVVGAICRGDTRGGSGGDTSRADPALRALLDRDATRVWGSLAVQGMIPDTLRAPRVADFRFAICQSVEQRRHLETCRYSRFAGYNEQTVVREERLWHVRLVDAISLETLDEDRFWSRDPAPCGDTEEFYVNSRSQIVRSGTIDTAHFVSWLENAVP